LNYLTAFKTVNGYIEAWSLSTEKCALLRPDKIDNVDSRIMGEKQQLQSEDEELETFLDELQRERNVKEISGWESGFPNLSRALDGMLPGLYLLIGRAGCGKTSFAKQLLDQVVMHNSVPGMFFSFAECKKELRIKTLSRLSGLESREIRRGSEYLLHWYGVPKRPAETEELPPSWEKVKKSAEAAKHFLKLIYLVECGRETNIRAIEHQVREVSSIKSSDRMMVVIDDCPRLGQSDQPITDRLANTAEQLQGMALDRNIPILAVWPDFIEEPKTSPQAWADKVPTANVILVIETDLERSKKLTEPNQAINLHIVKNRGGEKGNLAFDFFPAFSRFDELD
jgi:replicative DNA helicase